MWEPSGRFATICALGIFVILFGIGLLTQTTSPRYSPKFLTQQLVYSVGAACRQYCLEFGKSPASLADLTNNPGGLMLMIWGKSGTNDGWGHPIRFVPYDAALGYGSVTSYGRDGRLGGTEIDADVEVRFGDNLR